MQQHCFSYTSHATMLPNNSHIWSGHTCSNVGGSQTPSNAHWPRAQLTYLYLLDAEDCQKLDAAISRQKTPATLGAGLTNNNMETINQKAGWSKMLHNGEVSDLMSQNRKLVINYSSTNEIQGRNQNNQYYVRIHFILMVRISSCHDKYRIRLLDSLRRNTLALSTRC